MAQVPVKRAARPAPPRGTSRQCALVIGVSGYPAPLTKLPAVAADVRSIAKLLASKNGAFRSSGVNVLTEKQATRAAILAAVRDVFAAAKADDTIFAYFAGHGGVDGGAYYFAPYDADIRRLAETGVPLAEIKRMFDRTASRRAFLWLDFCHSGGILARGGKADDLSAIKREIGVVSGQGKIIVAACTPNQSAYEDPKLGHGLFTDALLRGLTGEAKSAQGEVTALSLYEFIDHQVKHPKQQPTFYGEMAGRVVLMHYPDRAATHSSAPASAAATKPTEAASATKKAGVVKASAASQVSTSGNLLLLGDRIYMARSVSERHDGSVEIQIIPKNPEEEATLRSLRGGRFPQDGNVGFAFRNQSFTGHVGEVSSLTVGSKPAWSVTLSPTDAHNNLMSGVGYNGITAEKLSDMRANLLLLGEPPEMGSGRDSILLSFVQGPLKDLGLTASVFKALWKRPGQRSGDFLREARLWAIYYLRASDVCDDVLELKLGPLRAGKLAVRFRGQRKSRYTNGEAQEVLVTGSCPLT